MLCLLCISRPTDLKKAATKPLSKFLKKKTQNYGQNDGSTRKRPSKSCANRANYTFFWLLNDLIIYYIVRK